VVVYLIITLLQIFSRVCQWQNCENWSIFGEDMDNSFGYWFLLDDGVIAVTCCNRCWHLPFWTICCLTTLRTYGLVTCHHTATCSTSLIACFRTMIHWEPCCLHNLNHCVLSTSSSLKLYVYAVYLMVVILVALVLFSA